MTEVLRLENGGGGGGRSGERVRVRVIFVGRWEGGFKGRDERGGGAGGGGDVDEEELVEQRGTRLAS